MYGTFEPVVFKVIWRSFYALVSKQIVTEKQLAVECNGLKLFLVGTGTYMGYI